MRPPLDGDNGVRHDQNSDLALLLVRIDGFDWLMLLNTVESIIAVDQSKLGLARCDEVSALAVTGGNSDIVLLHVSQKCFATIITPDGKQSRHFGGGGSEQGIGNDGLVFPAR